MYFGGDTITVHCHNTSKIRKRNDFIMKINGQEISLGDHFCYLGSISARWPDRGRWFILHRS